MIRLTRDAPALAAAARPVLRQDRARCSSDGAGIVKRAVPLTKALRVYARQSLPSAKLAGKLLPEPVATAASRTT